MALLASSVRTGFGERNENAALDALERQLGVPVVERNSEMRYWKVYSSTTSREETRKRGRQGQGKRQRQGQGLGQGQEWDIGEWQGPRQGPRQGQGQEWEVARALSHVIDLVEKHGGRVKPSLASLYHLQEEEEGKEEAKEHGDKEKEIKESASEAPLFCVAGRVDGVAYLRGEDGGIERIIVEVKSRVSAPRAGASVVPVRSPPHANLRR